MSAVLTAAERADLQSEIEAQMTTPVVIERYSETDDQAGGFVKGWADHLSTVCCAMPAFLNRKGEGKRGAGIESVTEWEVLMLLGTDVKSIDRLRFADGTRLHITAVRDSRTTDALCLSLDCYEAQPSE